MLHVHLKNEQFNKSADRNPVYLEYISFRSTVKIQPGIFYVMGHAPL